MSSDVPTSLAIPIALLGADAFLAARPASPVQVLHACAEAGFAAAYPVSWGDELVARETLARLAFDRPRCAILCACPLALRSVAQDTSGSSAIPVASPPVAAARMVRDAYAEQPIRITYVGSCPSGAEPEFDAHVSPKTFLATLLDRGIVLADQPDVFEGVLPPDRRRFYSMPGGCPVAERLAEVGYRLTDELPAAARQATDEPTLIDPSIASRCVCSGSGAPHGRDAIAELEPPRATHPVVDATMTVDLSPGPIVAAIVGRAPVSTDADLSRAPAALPNVIAGGGARSSPDQPLLQRAPSMSHGFPTDALQLPNGAGREFTRPVLPRSESVYENLPPGRRFTVTALIVALLLGVSLPLAAIGGWTLVRGNTRALLRDVAGDASARDSVSAAATIASPETSKLDSAGGSMLVDSTRGADSAARMSTLPSIEAQSAVEGGQRDTAGQAVLPSGSPSLGDTRAQSPRGSKSDSGSSSTARRSTRAPSASGQRPAAPPDSLRASRQAAPPELDSLVREIARRRARVDSLNHVMDSLNRVPKRPSPFR